MTSVAYRVEPPAPGWLWTAGGLVAGWLVAAFATGVLYVVAGLRRGNQPHLSAPTRAR